MNPIKITFVNSLNYIVRNRLKENPDTLSKNDILSRIEISGNSDIKPFITPFRPNGKGQLAFDYCTNYWSTEEVEVKAFLNKIVGIESSSLGSAYSSITAILEKNYNSREVTVMKHDTRANAQFTALVKRVGPLEIDVYAIGFHHGPRTNTHTYILNKYFQPSGDYKKDIIVTV